MAKRPNEFQAEPKPLEPSGQAEWLALGQALGQIPRLARAARWRGRWGDSEKEKEKEKEEEEEEAEEQGVREGEPLDGELESMTTRMRKAFSILHLISSLSQTPRRYKTRSSL